MRVLLVEHESEEAQRMAQGLNEADYRWLTPEQLEQQLQPAPPVQKQEAP